MMIVMATDLAQVLLTRFESPTANLSTHSAGLLVPAVPPTTDDITEESGHCEEGKKEVDVHPGTRNLMRPSLRCSLMMQVPGSVAMRGPNWIVASCLISASSVWFPAHGPLKCTAFSFDGWKCGRPSSPLSMRVRLCPWDRNPARPPGTQPRQPTWATSTRTLPDIPWVSGGACTGLCSW